MKPGAPSLLCTRLLDQSRKRIRSLHYRFKFDKYYHFFIIWSAIQTGGIRHPGEIGVADVEAFLSMLVNGLKLLASTTASLLNTLRFA
jgi:hypothetical protein